jgi:hypothetical protein
MCWGVGAIANTSTDHVIQRDPSQIDTYTTSGIGSLELSEYIKHIYM